MNIVVVGMGKIGLPLAVQFASKGHKVFGCDVNENTVYLVNKGMEPFPGEEFLSEKLKQVVKSKNLLATRNTTQAVSDAEVVVVVVPLFVDEEGSPNFEWMDSATRDIGHGLKPGTLVTYETTLPVGTTRNRFGKILEEVSGLKPGTDFYLAFSPERVFTGRVFADLKKYPKLVGGIDELSGLKAENFYRQVLDFDERPDLPKPNGVWNLGSTEASELAKLAETTYRDVNIGLANQFALFASQNSVDIYSVIEACNSQPFSHIHQPGISVGGHCIPIYPQFYLWNDPLASIVRSAREANSSVPQQTVNSIKNMLVSLEGLKAVILGAAYRSSVKETAFSGVFDLADALEKHGCKVFVHDPLYTDQELIDLGLKPYSLGEKVDIAVLHTNHKEYTNLSEKDFPELKLMFDGRNFLNPKNFRSIKFYCLGKEL